MSNYSTELVKSLYIDEKNKELMRAQVEETVNTLLEATIDSFLGYERCSYKNG